MIQIQILAPPEHVVPAELEQELREVLTRIEVPFQICDTTINLAGSTEAEARFVLRILQRAGYDLQIHETPSIDTDGAPESGPRHSAD